MQDLKVTLIQSDLHWENSLANFAMFEEKIWQISEPSDLIVLPEMFTTGFSMKASALAEPMNYHATKWLKQMSGQTKAVITGSVIIKENNQYYNRLFWVEPNGTISTYDKRHLFRMAGEDNVYQSGTAKMIKQIKGWNVCPLVCYDLRFPVWSRNRNNEYDLLLYVANWPEVRSYAWKTLLRARAIENIAYVVGVNRVGKDGNGHSYSGDSVVLDAKGGVIQEISGEEGIITVTLSKKELLEFRERFPANLDADSFSIES